MGQVWEASDGTRTVALKTLLPDKAISPDSVGRFCLEIVILRRLEKVPGIVRIREHDTEFQPFYFVMDYMIKGHLGKLIEARKGLSATREGVVGLVETLAKVCDAVDRAHGEGIAHRDLKPQNILLDAGFEPHVSDFGLACWAQGENHFTAADGHVGTKGYRPPEKPTEWNDIVRGDVYSIGVILYQILAAGERPRDTSSSPPPPHELVAELKGFSEEALKEMRRAREQVYELEQVSLKCLEARPDNRYATAKEVGDELRRWLGEETVHAAKWTDRAARWVWANVTRSLWLAAVVIIGGGALLPLYVWPFSNVAFGWGWTVGAFALLPLIGLVMHLGVIGRRGEWGRPAAACGAIAAVVAMIVGVARRSFWIYLRPTIPFDKIPDPENPKELEAAKKTAWEAFQLLQDWEAFSGLLFFAYLFTLCLALPLFLVQTHYARTFVWEKIGGRSYFSWPMIRIYFWYLKWSIPFTALLAFTWVSAKVVVRAIIDSPLDGGPNPGGWPFWSLLALLAALWVLFGLRSSQDSKRLGVARWFYLGIHPLLPAFWFLTPYVSTWEDMAFYPALGVTALYLIVGLITLCLLVKMWRNCRDRRRPAQKGPSPSSGRAATGDAPPAPGGASAAPPQPEA